MDLQVLSSNEKFHGEVPMAGKVEILDLINKLEELCFRFDGSMTNELDLTCVLILRLHLNLEEEMHTFYMIKQSPKPLLRDIFSDFTSSGFHPSRVI